MYSCISPSPSVSNTTLNPSYSLTPLHYITPISVSSSNSHPISPSNTIHHPHLTTKTQSKIQTYIHIPSSHYPSIIQNLFATEQPYHSQSSTLISPLLHHSYFLQIHSTSSSPVTAINFIMHSVTITIIQMCCIILTTISLLLDVLLNTVYPLLIILGLGAVKMVSESVVNLIDGEEIRRNLKNRLESDVQKDDLIRKLKQDIESEIKTRKQIQEIGDAATRAIHRQLLEKRAELKRAYDRIKELEMIDQARRTRRSERLLRRDGAYSAFGAGPRWRFDSSGSSTYISRGRQLPQLDPTDV